MRGQRRAYLLGYPVGHSISKPVHEAAYRELGEAIVYVPLEVRPENLVAALEQVRAADCVGANVTMPHKEAVGRTVDWRSGTVERCGAVSMIRNESGRLAGYSSDVIGLERALARQRTKLASGTAVVLGAGGAAAAAVEALAQGGAPEIVVCARREEAATALATRMGSVVPVPVRGSALTDLPHQVDGAALLLNATSVGMRATDSRLVDGALLHEGLLVYDYVYRRDGLTKLHEDAVAADAPFVDGAAHLLEQALPTVELWTGKEAPAEAMRAALVAEIGREPVTWANESDGAQVV